MSDSESFCTAVTLYLPRCADVPTGSMGMSPEKARTLRVPRRVAGILARDSREVAHAAISPGSGRGFSQVSSVHHISLPMALDAGANMARMSKKCSVENGRASASWRVNKDGMEVVGGMVGVITDPGRRMS